MRAVDELAGIIVAERYTIRQLIGQGGIGKVYKVTDGRLERSGALKILLSRLAKQPKFAQLLEHEAKTTAALRHPNIVNIYDRGQFDGLSFIVSEYVDGCSLKEVLNGLKSPLTLPQTVSIAAAVGRALSFAHDARVVHRDIKPSNILLSRTGEVLLTDFGLATVGGRSGLNDAGAIIGTPEYMSPEQASGGQVDRRSDIYSLGIILYECLEGVRPFSRGNSAANGTAATRRNEDGHRELITQVMPANLTPVFLRALNPDRNQRFTSVEEFVEAFTEAAGGDNGERLASLVCDPESPGVPADTSVFAPEQVRLEDPVPAVYALSVTSGTTSRGTAEPGRAPQPFVREAIDAEPQRSGDLLIRTSDGSTRQVSLTGERLTLGRSSNCELSYPDDSGLSRQHMAFVAVGPRWAVQDLGSKNGTIVNGARVNGIVTLEHGDRILAGHLTIEFSTSAAAAPVRIVFDDEAMEGSSSVVQNLARSQQAFASPEGLEANRTQALIRAGRELAGDRPLGELFRIILDLSIEAVGAQRGVLLTLDGDELAVRAARGEGFRISSSVRNRVLQDAYSILVQDAQLDDAFRDKISIVEQEVRSLMAVPLQANERVIGLIYVDSPHLQRPFTRDDLSLLTVMANVATIRIEHARLAEFEGFERVMARELEQAAQIQKELIPTQAPEMQGFDIFGAVSRCRTVGGDYFDFLPHADGRMAVVLADVSGKGLPAALLMSSLQPRVQILFEDTDDLARQVGRLNAAVSSKIPSNRFITFFVCVLDPESGKVIYVNAGHSPPLLVRANGAPAEHIPGGGVVLGILPNIEYHQSECTLQEGDIMVLFSDGVSEAVRPDQEEFGEGRIAEVVSRHQHESAERIAQGIVSAVHGFIADQPISDDLTVVLIKRSGDSSPRRTLAGRDGADSDE